MKWISYLLCIWVIGVCGCTRQEEKKTKEVSLLAQVPAEKLQTKATLVIQTSLSDTSAYMRNHAIEVAIETKQRQLMPEILKKLEDTSVAVRFTAAIAVGDMDCQTCKEQISKSLKDTDENVRIGAAYSMIRLGDKSGYPLIRDAAVSADPTLRANALLLLGKLGNKKDDLPLIHKALSDAETVDKVRIQAVDSIARLKDTEIYRSKLWPLLISKYADDRVMGIRGMGLLGTREARDAIQTMLQDDVLEVRLCAAEELGKLDDQSGMNQLVTYFQTNPDLNQATMASGTGIMAIGRLKAMNLTGYLDKALDSQSPYIRLAAAQSALLMKK
jgi:HEAT repeat protein